ncbi:MULTISPECIES: MFS transporter [Actinoalloteichus]|uniref:Arabinose efflux permease family protein n=1 Tax=Actinoalloteichus fjordicus TaxID=1612552 RepID=A0AAC9PS35_9PSEU|nr:MULTISPECIES: MFS transporter [Actinoalloteichus]APU14615.1 arabinose efflux permease family protein [Actinoalloteichus fjordicus]APU20583.1 arabinose efflux permease family protein [Actinoalloteichus sp. GBA129-24]
MRRDLRLYWIGQSSTSVGSAFTAVAIPLIAVQTVGATGVQMGLLTAASSLSVLLFGLPLATLADRLPRKRPWLIGAELVAAAAVGVVALGVAGNWVDVGLLAAFAFVLGCLGALTEAVYFAHLGSIVDRDGQTRARAHLQSGEFVGDLTGRGLAGPLIAITGPVGALLVNIGTRLISALCLVRIAAPERPTSPTGRRVRPADLLAGFRAIGDSPYLRRLAPFLAVSQVMRGMVAALTALFVLTVLEVPALWYGALFVVSGLCGLAGSLVAARLADRVVPQRLATVGFAGVAATTALLPLASGPLPLAMAVAAFGLGLPIFCGAVANVGMVGFAGRELGEEVLGRFSASFQLVGTLAFILGSVAAGLLSEIIGIRPTLWAAVVIGLLALILLPAARHGAGPQTAAPRTATPRPETSQSDTSQSETSQSETSQTATPRTEPDRTVQPQAAAPRTTAARRTGTGPDAVVPRSASASPAAETTRSTAWDGDPDRRAVAESPTTTAADNRPEVAR